MTLAPFDLDKSPPRPEYEEISRRELRETPEVREAAIEHLRNLLHNATDLHYDDSDEFLLIFLRPCHFYPESALKMMRRIAEFKKNNYPLMHNLYPEDEKRSFMEHGIVNVLTNRDQKGRRIMVINCGKAWDPRQIDGNRLFRMFFLIHLMAQLEPTTQINGVVIIMDFDGLSLKQVRGMSPSFSKLLLTFIQEAVPLRMKEVHIIKQPYIFNMVWTLFKPFIGDKLRDRLEFHGSDMKKLHKFIDPSDLPKNYGGTRPALDYGSRDWYPCLEKHVDHVLKWNTYGYASGP
ncbi:clavesin-1-like [Toxorhynchites rutilus septentrionalis]|uniref:clavesin-1-like n=1 Tax=Toxorhynchites rutilus septentrionalis TaxID=329112 RepID=UPI0024793A99|nr:clavesin-1-like [Toxorhynchites rutilus septentrionalis]